jgi:hypothetical protein
MVYPICLCCVKNCDCCVGALVQIWSLCVSYNIIGFIKNSFKLYWFIKFYNGNDLDIFINILILKSPITIVGNLLVCRK